MFESMNTVVLRELDALKIQDEQDGGDEGVDYGEVFTDFATPEFLDKNVRVRPISGVTHGDDTRDGRQSSPDWSGGPKTWTGLKIGTMY